MSPKKQSLYLMLLIVVILLFICLDSNWVLAAFVPGMPQFQQPGFPSNPQNMPTNPRQLGSWPGYTNSPIPGQIPSYGLPQHASMPLKHKSSKKKKKSKLAISDTPVLGNIKPSDILKKATPFLLKKYVPERLEPPSPPNTSPSKDFSKLMERLDKRNEKTETMLESVAPSPESCSNPTKIFSRLSEIGQKIGNSER